jgi:hypothetical protein
MITNRKRAINEIITAAAGIAFYGSELVLSMIIG